MPLSACKCRAVIGSDEDQRYLLLQSILHLSMVFCFTFAVKHPLTVFVEPSARRSRKFIILWHVFEALGTDSKNSSCRNGCLGPGSTSC